ncbi:MAG: FMN-binding protein [Planctomycetota bacterium]|jgi:electron transport complex protein RnfG
MSTNEKKNPALFFLEKSWLLMSAAIVFGTLLASLNYAWSDKIKLNEIEKFNRKAKGLLTEADSFEALAETLAIDIGKGKVYNVEVKKALDAEGALVGWAFVCEGSGFADKIKLVIAADAAFDTVIGFDVLSSYETPGFGDKINIKDGFYQSQFKGAPADDLELVKVGNADTIDSQIVSITGATVTSSAVVDIFNTFLISVKETLAKENLL